MGRVPRWRIRNQRAAIGPERGQSEQSKETMNQGVRIGLVGDHDSSVPAHVAIPRAFTMASGILKRPVDYDWIPTQEIREPERLRSYDGLWCVPASPYRSTDGALRAIRWAREQKRPFLGTCGGFQHAILEYARSVLGWSDAEHAETAPNAARTVIAPLACALVEATDSIRFRAGSRLAAAYGRLEVTEGYRCRYGLNPTFEAALFSGCLRATAKDAAGEVRGVELEGHPFFVATLFQPERAALENRLPPLVAAFVNATAENKVARGI
jgi:CTP synthase (UTP-ammonia lyase)